MILGKAAIADGKGNFSIEDIKIGNPKNDEVLVKIMASGVCHTDFDSYKQWTKEFILGHEGAGIVLKVGKDVANVVPGDKVILNWSIPCNNCFQCKNENFNICENNSPVAGTNPGLPGHANMEGTLYRGKGIERSFNLGTMSTHTIVKEAAVVKYIHDIPFTSASIIGCGVMTGVGSVINTAKVTKESSVVVLGTGGVGLNVIQGAKITNASKIIAVDVSENRLKLSKKFGSTHQILADRDDKGLLKVVEQVKSLTDNRGADFVFECTGVPALGATLLAMIRNAGSAVQVSGIEEEIIFNMQLFEWDKKYINPLYGKCNPQQDFPKILDYYASENLLLDELITKTYTLDNLEVAFEDMLNGTNAKGVIIFDKVKE
ncbi:S-(hydroxymethyl)glutathione dehydrogenase [Yeosuana aromativorans]|uniref:S-(Hydroxymethyl)glutathione dehydrogenase n=1 Tax=Yeosuana aromativorans TaxID=288019 RepID=A0A8J3BSF7_9FLAO|nr:alcohol dehydrogenase catalytic domain-containing protein [Yeosuana aromativorans]GGK34072.1 S-(hydroxymethyl)glutathione dehydrogenase [Yeosuana aromativorans]